MLYLAPHLGAEKKISSLLVLLLFLLAMEFPTSAESFPRSENEKNTSSLLSVYNQCNNNLEQFTIYIANQDQQQENNWSDDLIFL